VPLQQAYLAVDVLVAGVPSSQSTYPKPSLQVDSLKLRRLVYFALGRSTPYDVGIYTNISISYSFSSPSALCKVPHMKELGQI
jgi:hypothetical protein